MFGADKGTADKLDGKKLHIGIVQARFNEGITNTLAAACREELIALGVQETHIDHVLVPGALPSIFVGFRVGIGIAWMALVAGEMVAASSGLGFLIMQGRQLFRPDFIIVGMVAIGIIGLGLDFAVRLARKWIMRWEQV